MLKLNRAKVVIVCLVVAVLVLSSYIGLYHFGAEVSAQSNFLNVKVVGSTELNVNSTATFSVLVNNSYSGKLSYEWSIFPNDNKTFLLPLDDGSQCNLTFVEATDDAYSLSCEATDLVVGNQGSGSLAVYDPYTSPNLYLGAYGASYSYLVETDGLGWYRAIDGKTGMAKYPSPNASYTINSAIENLTLSRTWKEKIVCLGNFELTVPILLPSYTILEIQGKLSLAINSNVDVIENSDIINGNTAIEVRGGHIDGNQANQNAGCLIHWKGVQDSVIEGMYLEDSYDSAIKIERPTGVLTETNRILNNRIRTSAHGYGIEVPYDSLISDNYIDYNNLGGIYSFSTLGAGGLVISDNHIWGNGNGIYLKGSSDNIVEGNYIEHNYWNGILVESYGAIASGYQTISNNILKNNGRETANSFDGIKLIGLSNNTIGQTIITGNRIYDSSTHRYAIYGEYAAYMTITNNRLEAASGTIFGIDTGTSIIDNNSS